MIAKIGVDTDPIRFGHDTLMGRLKKANGETVCLVAHERNLTTDLVAKIHEVMSSLKIHMSEDDIRKQSITHARALLLTSDDTIGPNNPPTIFDVEIGWENVVPSKK
jgi:hypothetical protein